MTSPTHPLITPPPCMHAQPPNPLPSFPSSNQNLTDIPIHQVPLQFPTLSEPSHKNPKPRRKYIPKNPIAKAGSRKRKITNQDVQMDDDISLPSKRPQLSLDIVVAEAAAQPPRNYDRDQLELSRLGGPWTVKRIEFLKARFNLFGVCVESNGRAGGLALLWNKDIDIQLQSLSSHHIDVDVLPKNSDGKWRFTGFYGHPEASQRKESWNLLRRLHGQSAQPWVCIGDFNEILHQEEKRGRTQHPLWQILDFRQAIDDCSIHDLGFQGHSFTWSNKREPPHNVMARLDRACANSDWSARFSNATVEVLPILGSDHAPLILNMTPQLQSDFEKPIKSMAF
ncbi:UNVERIFIED_CONTAM: hypothetical protein Slati_4124400 [Sesamum latifolium]|uniref:Endonuclease/exonuclease/phosphatase domain-containing protein n=1 Tax=Sesamum latifolium TaxID=2727402 RepID=A0AAW2T7U6_9LAMI